MSIKPSKINPAQQIVTIIIEMDKPVYSPGDTVSGKIYLDVVSSQPPSILNLKFSGTEFWSRSTIIYSHTTQKHKIIDTNWSIYKWDTGLPVGHIEVPFSFVLPSELPASFHAEDLDFLAHITYKLEATLKSETKTIAIAHKKLAIRKPITRLPQSHSEEKKIPLTTWPYISQGYLNLNAHFESDIYSEGEQVRVVLEADTSCSNLDIDKIYFNLVHKVTLNGFHGKTYCRRIASAWAPEIPAKTQSRPQILALYPPQFSGDDHDLDTNLPHPSRDSEGFSTATNGNIITSEFFLEVCFKIKSFTATSPKICHCIDMSVPCSKPENINTKLADCWNPKTLPKADLGKVLTLEEQLESR